MRRLSGAELRRKLAFDYASVMALQGPLIQASPYASMLELGRRRPLALAQAEAGGAQAYLVRYGYNVLNGPGQRAPYAEVKFDLDTGNYPFSPPRVQVASGAWGPHIDGMTGLVCIGSYWARSEGNYLLGHLVLHMGRLLNFAETKFHKDGLNKDAIKYWRDALHGGPLNPELVLPTIPTELSHGVSDAPPLRVNRVGSAPVGVGAPPAIRIRGGEGIRLARRGG